MSNRITQKDLDGMVERINKITGSPLSPYTKNEQGQCKPNAHCYHLDWAYGGVCLVRMCDYGSGITSISQIGFATKRNLYNWMSAYLNGLQTQITEAASYMKG